MCQEKVLWSFNKGVEGRQTTKINGLKGKRSSLPLESTLLWDGDMPDGAISIMS